MKETNLEGSYPDSSLSSNCIAGQHDAGEEREGIPGRGRLPWGGLGQPLCFCGPLARRELRRPRALYCTQDRTTPTTEPMTPPAIIVRGVDNTR